MTPDASPPDASRADAPEAGGSDGSLPPPDPQAAEVRAGSLRLELRTDPLRVVLRDAARGDLLASVAEGALLIGVAPGGDTAFHDPRRAEPPGMQWHAVEVGVGRSPDGAVRVRDDDGHEVQLALVARDDGALGLQVGAVGPRAAEVALLRWRWEAPEGARYYGLGERLGHADARGNVVAMQLHLGGTASGTNETHVPVPFVVSPQGWGLFAESREAGAFDMAATDPAQWWLTFEGRELKLWLFADADPLRVVAAYTRSTGLPRLPPRWAFAPMHWRNEWASGEELLEVADRIRQEDVPTTCIWIDNPWQRSYNDHRFDEDRFPDPAVLLEALRARGYRPLLWSAPYLDAVSGEVEPSNEAERLFLRFRDEGWLVRWARGGQPFVSPASPGAPGALVDFTAEGAVAAWKARLALLVAMGVRAFKLDYGEDVIVELGGRRLGLRFADGDTERQLHNVYAMRYHRPYREALDEGASEEGGFLLVRASAWGGQQVADIVWPGDLDNDFREGLDGEVGGLPAAVTALQSLAASGFPSFASDTGGYRGGMPSREALLRWAEHTALSPLLQLGGAGAHHEPWLYDAEAGAIYRELARLHMRLVPYLRVLALEASRSGIPPVRSVPLAHPEDAEAGGEDPYAYLLGPDLFVAPVVQPGATERRVHLPPGRWVDWWAGEPGRAAGVLEGPTDVTVATPLGRPALFVRVGAVLPMLPADVDTLVPTEGEQVVGPEDRPWLEARVWPGEGREVVTEEGLLLHAERLADGLLLRVEPRAEGLRDVRLEVRLDGAWPPLAGVGTPLVDGVPLPASADAAAVRAGCDGVCWAVEGRTLWVSLRGPAPHELRFPEADGAGG